MATSVVLAEDAFETRVPRQPREAANASPSYPTPELLASGFCLTSWRIVPVPDHGARFWRIGTCWGLEREIDRYQWANPRWAEPSAAPADLTSKETALAECDEWHSASLVIRFAP